MNKSNIIGQHQVVIIGCGVSGIACAVKLRKSGIDDFVILEKSDRVGGTWRENTYPGCGCDVPSSLYSFSFNLNPKWSRAYASQPEILRYIEATVDKVSLRTSIRMQTDMQDAHWDEREKCWHIHTNKGVYKAQFIILAAGPITRPSIPSIDGIDTFSGEVFHSAQWRHECDLKNKRVAVIGTGASAIQFIPELQKEVKQLYVFQRTPAWVFPRPNRHISSLEKNVRTHVDFIDRAERKLIEKALLIVNYGLLHPWLLRAIEPQAKALLKHQISDKALRKKLTPNFTIGCKRMLFSNNYYSTLQKDNVELIASPLKQVSENSVESAQGDVREVDTIIFGTGFDVTRPPIAEKITCLDGKKLSEKWQREGPEAYMGTTLKDMPNAFLMVGPNILVYSSFIGIAEWQSNYIVDAINQARRSKIKVLTMTAEKSDEYNSVVQKMLKGTVWTRGNCSSYYLDSEGKNYASWPWSVPELKKRLSHFDIENYLTNW